MPSHPRGFDCLKYVKIEPDPFNHVNDVVQSNVGPFLVRYIPQNGYVYILEIDFQIVHN